MAVKITKKFISENTEVIRVYGSKYLFVFDHSDLRFFLNRAGEKQTNTLILQSVNDGEVIPIGNARTKSEFIQIVHDRIKYPNNKELYNAFGITRDEIQALHSAINQFEYNIEAGADGDYLGYAELKIYHIRQLLFKMNKQ